MNQEASAATAQPSINAHPVAFMDISTASCTRGLHVIIGETVERRRRLIAGFSGGWDHASTGRGRIVSFSPPFFQLRPQDRVLDPSALAAYFKHDDERLPM
ncbi:hypothetical protein H6P81_020798 [Aristolochia fimbriata]|uniref:Uncharacterized protein n=1 Tax=Aristolochia fimbriata TaxID=158543 RepID=A0AAV7DVK5_ARIFI|nr:hypothetical protein H6P81_020798 [Aristolochia fimbriata]